MEVRLVQCEPAFHLLSERQRVRGHECPSNTPSATRSANAAIVNEGFGPTGPGMAAPSTTNNPGWPCTSPHGSTTPVLGSTLIGHPPNGCTVITCLNNHS